MTKSKGADSEETDKNNKVNILIQFIKFLNYKNSLIIKSIL